ncbi:hypothetical protein NQZ68_002608 [Dissostichus eleginoides]|nr:hypothetical protein NQZ68_002608 [Dissostichus eleginoides]
MTLDGISAILGRSETKQCAYYNSNWEKERTNRSGIEPCRGEEDKRRHCFATWKNVSGAVEVVKQGCWLDDVNCYDSDKVDGAARTVWVPLLRRRRLASLESPDSECLEKKESPDVFFCCCEGNMCNEKFLYAPEVPQPEHRIILPPTTPCREKKLSDNRPERPTMQLVQPRRPQLVLSPPSPPTPRMASGRRRSDRGCPIRRSHLVMAARAEPAGVTLQRSHTVHSSVIFGRADYKPQLFSTLLYSLVPIIGLAAVVLFSFWMWRHHKLAYPAALVPTHAVMSQQRQSYILCSSAARGKRKPKQSFHRMEEDGVGVAAATIMDALGEVELKNY